MKWLTRIALVLLALVAVLAIVPFFVTVNDYIPTLEKELSARLQEPVSIDALRASMLPVPYVTADGITVGGAEDIRVGKVTLKPALWSLLASRTVIRAVELEDVTLTQKALGSLAGLAQRDTGSGKITVENVRLRNAMLKLEQGSFGPFDADVEVENGGERGTVSLKTRDGALDARLTPREGRYALEISAQSWTPPLGPPIRLDELKVKGTATTTGAELSDISGKLYGGTVAGKASLTWGKGMTLKGELEVKQVELKDAAALISPTTRVSGRLDAKPAFTASAAKVSLLDEALRLETPFTVHNGVLHGFDLANAAAALLKQGASGGQTRFDELAGHLATEGKRYRFTQLRIASGALAARGHITIAPSKALSGQLSTSVRGVGAAANIPLTVAGTLDSPVLYPSTTALIGAAAGTAVLGPGLGTAAGAKVGEIVEGLLGKKK